MTITTNNQPSDLLNVYHSTVERYQAVTNDHEEKAVAAHVEALIELGWRWEGRGLVPTIGSVCRDRIVATTANASTKLDNIR